MIMERKYRFSIVALFISIYFSISIQNVFGLDLNNSCYTSSNPYYNSGYGGQCTAFAWGRVCEKNDIRLIFKNKSYPSAKYWHSYGPADSLNLETGTSVQSNSIAVWGGDSANEHGHVAYVERVENGTVYFNEANVDTYNGTNWGGGYDGYEKSLSINSFENRGTGIGRILGYIYMGNGGVIPSDKPDLTVKEIYFTDHRTTFFAGESFRIYTRIKNDGDSDVYHDIRIEYYLSEGTKVDDDPIDTWHDDIKKEKLESGESEWEDKGVIAPSEPDTYNITVCADTDDEIDEEHESNNCYGSPVIFEVVNNPAPQISAEAVIMIVSNIILDYDPVPGDLDGDNLVSIADAVLALKIMSDFVNQPVSTESE